MRRRWLTWLLLVAVLAGCAPAGAARGPAAEPNLVRVTLLQINDVYEVEPVDGGRRGGMARLATLVKAAKRENPNTVFALAGDVLSPSVMSTFLKGEQMIEALNAAGLDVATFGNHEFDFGPATLAERIRASRFVWLASNVLDRRTGAPFGGAKRDVVRSLGGVSVGFLGVTTPETAATSASGPDVLFRDTLATAREVARELRQRGATLVVALTHQPMARDRELAEAGGIDVILGGHEHEPLVAEAGRAVITKAGSDARYLVRVDLWVTPAGEVVERSWRFDEVSRRVPPDPDVEKLVKGYTERLDRVLDVEIGRTAVPLEARRTKLRTEETNTGNLIADAMRARLGADVAVMNGGGVRTDRVIAAGRLTRRDVHSLLPFANVVLKVALTGRQLRAVLEHGLAQVEHESGAFLQLSGVRLTYDPGRQSGSRLVAVEVAGAPLDDARGYTVAVTDYLYRGGDGYTVFRQGNVLVGPESGPPLTTTILDAITERGTIAPRVEERVRRAAR